MHLVPFRDRSSFSPPEVNVSDSSGFNAFNCNPHRNYDLQRKLLSVHFIPDPLWLNDPVPTGSGSTTLLIHVYVAGQALQGRRLEDLSVTELSQILSDVETLVRDLSEELVQDLGVSAELEFEKVERAAPIGPREIPLLNKNHW